MKKILALFLCFPFAAYAHYESYCDVSSHSPTYGMDYNQASELVWKSKPKASVDVGSLIILSLCALVMRGSAQFFL